MENSLGGGTQPPRSDKEKMIRGSAWMTAGSVFSRILGAIYVIPWRIWLGAAFLTANALFTKGYQIYSLFLIISTAGVPGAVSKQVARYNAMGEYKTGMRLFYHGTIAMLLMGVLSCGAMWLLAPLLAAGDARMIPVFRSLAWPLLLIPSLSLIRGFFQGYNEMAPSAISQFVEQVARILYMLVMTYAIMVAGNHHYLDAVVHSTFAAFIGAVFGLGLLVVYFVQQKPRLDALEAQSKQALNISVNEILLDVVRQAIPFIIMDSTINIYYIIDQYTFNPMMKAFYRVSEDQLDRFYALFAGNANKLIMIIVSLAVAMAITVVPLLAGAKTRGDVAGLARQITNTLQLFFIVMIPSAFGMVAVARPLYVLFYRDMDWLGIRLLQWSSILAILLGLFTVLAAILQGLFNNRLAIQEMLVGMAVKVIAQWPMIFFFDVYGPIIATMLGMTVSSLLMLYSTNRMYNIHVRQTIRRGIGILAFSLIMCAVCYLIVNLSGMIINPQSQFGAALVLLVAVGVGVLIYGYLILKTRLADMIIGERVSRLREILHIR